MTPDRGQVAVEQESAARVRAALDQKQGGASGKSLGAARVGDGLLVVRLGQVGTGQGDRRGAFPRPFSPRQRRAAVRTETCALGAGSPAANGARLAEDVLQRDPSTWTDLVIDARGCPPEYLNSAFFNAVWQKIAEKRSKQLNKAKAIRWEFTHDFQRIAYDYLRENFKPRVPA